MKIERLRNKRIMLIFLCGFLIVVILLITLVFKGSKAKYRNSNIIPLINTKVKNNVPSFTTMGIYLETSSDTAGAEQKGGKYYKKQESTDKMPRAGYIINKTNSYCNKFNSATNTSEPDNNVKLFTNEYGQHIMYGLSKGDKCYIYLDKTKIAIKNLLAQWGYPDITEVTERPASDFTGATKVKKSGRDTANDRDLVYKAPDDDGTSYYFAGSPKYNWVKFGGFYWRIVRINGDGTLRMIYSGAGTPSEKGAGTTINVGGFNLEQFKAELNGYWYTEGVRNGNDTPSEIYKEVNKFYKNNLASENIDKYIDKTAGFCNDRTLATNNLEGATGVGRTMTYSAASQRISNNPISSPILTCPDKINDLFTTQTGKLNGKGNGALEHPIGLITADEASLAGMFSGSVGENIDNYLAIGDNYWTMTPWGLDTNQYPVGFVFIVHGNGCLNQVYNNWHMNIRPVINLVKDITFSKGNGSISSPFEI